MNNYKPIGSGISIVGIGGAAVGAGILFGNFISSVGRNPIMEDKLFKLNLICFALIESFALFSLLISFLILYG